MYGGVIVYMVQRERESEFAYIEGKSQKFTREIYYLLN